MQFSILSIVLFGLVVVTSSGFKFEEVRDNLRALTKFLAPHRAASSVSGVRNRRQSSSECNEAIQEVQSDRFQQCYDAVSKAEELDATTSDLTTYCGNDCTSYVIDVSTKLAQYCDPGVSCLMTCIARLLLLPYG